MSDREKVTHELKTVPEHFKAVWRGKKTAEIRWNDRDFSIGDKLLLKEWLPRKRAFTGREIETPITDILWLRRLIPLDLSADRWVMLSIGWLLKSNPKRVAQ